MPSATVTVVLLVTQCHSYTCLSTGDSFKIKIKKDIIAIGQKHTSHKINKYITTSAP